MTKHAVAQLLFLASAIGVFKIEWPKAQSAIGAFKNRAPKGSQELESGPQEFSIDFPIDEVTLPGHS